MSKIHPLACVSPKAKIGENVEIGPYAYIDDEVEIGDGTKIQPHAVIYNYVRRTVRSSRVPLWEPSRRTSSSTGR